MFDLLSHLRKPQKTKYAACQKNYVWDIRLPRIANNDIDIRRKMSILEEGELVPAVQISTAILEMLQRNHKQACNLAPKEFYPTTIKQ